MAAPERAPAPAVERTVAAGDLQISCRVFGEGEPLLLIMGYGSTMNLWEPRLVTQLASRHRVILFDNRGMGGTGAGLRDFSIEQFADDASALLDALEISRAHVLGWSMGSLVAQELALRHPGKVDRLVLYAGHPGAEMFPPAPEVLQKLTDPSGGPAERGRRFISALFPAGWLGDNGERIREIFFRPMGTVPPESLGMQAKAIESWGGSSGRLGSLCHAALVISGAEDVLVVPENARFLAGRMPKAELALIEGAGHGLMFQLPDVFCRRVLEFLQG